MKVTGEYHKNQKEIITVGARGEFLSLYTMIIMCKNMTCVARPTLDHWCCPTIQTVHESKTQFSSELM